MEGIIPESKLSALPVRESSSERDGNDEPINLGDTEGSKEEKIISPHLPLSLRVLITLMVQPPASPDSVCELQPVH